MAEREAELRARIDEDPSDAEALREMAERIGRDRRRKADAVGWWRRYADAVAEPERAGALLRLARAQVEVRDEAGAIGTLERCVEADPELAEAWDLKGELLRRSDRMEEAVEALGRAAELDRTAIRPRVALVTCYRALGRERQANAMLAAIRKIAGENPAIDALVKELMHRHG